MRLLSGLDDRIGAHAYPATTEEVIEEYGDIELELPNGDEQLGDVLGRLETETFETAEDLRLATLSAVSSNAIGRKGYSDRDPSCLGEDGHDQVSF
ncbi:DUF5789 family protein [Halorientalis pallida]|uniref:DUF2795 domain-containing protein n=1 Tax=Halorientalis pallida TaxID=2479928 RepID=A0A498L5N7_9EURY|nr:DUF2795 domain-containing protein [Halorientalis pallida]RXK50607.1 DUF2795 domain-containing protein [Halorientalis pallida]